MERLTAEDQLMLWPDRIWPQDIGALAVLDGSGLLPPPGDEAALLLATEQLRRRRLDRSHPLWEMWFLPGLPDQRIGLFVRLHHTIADGIAAVATIGTFLDATPDAPVPPAQPWTPAPVPTARELLADNLRRHVDQLGRAASTVIRPVTTARRIRAAWPATRQVFAEVPTPVTSLNRPVGPDRGIALIRSGMDLVKETVRLVDGFSSQVRTAVRRG